MATQITATTPRTQLTPRVGVFKVAILIVMAAAVIGVGVWSQAGSVLTPASTVDLARPYEPGLPLQGGFAGASGLDSGD